MSSAIFVISSLLTITVAQNLGDPTQLINFPPCAANCQISVANRTVRYPFYASSFYTYLTPIIKASNPNTNPNNVTFACSAVNRASTASCEKVSCTDAEYTKTQDLAEKLCGSLYTNGTINPSPVSAAISSATAAAASAVAGKNASNINDYPACARSCQQQYLPVSGCGTLANASCICNSPALLSDTGRCEVANCSAADLVTTRALAQRLCSTVGGVGNASEVADQFIASQTASSGMMGPTAGVMPFTGGAAIRRVEMGSWVVLLGALVGAYVTL
ncbi:MAG: hypothetical protein Q9186_001465 [Xanthomendoza sp. 1 TL-2023]